MTTHSVLPTAPSDQPEALIPYPFELELSDEEVRRFQATLQKESHVEISFAEAKQRGLEILRLSLMLMAERRYQELLKEPPVLNRELVSPPPPTPEAFRIPRWALVALYDALGHALAMNRPAGYRHESGREELVRLFRAVSAERPELPQVEESIAEVERLRTVFIRLAVTRWPVRRDRLAGIFLNCLLVIKRLRPGMKEVEVATALVEIALMSTRAE